MDSGSDEDFSADMIGVFQIYNVLSPAKLSHVVYDDLPNYRLINLIGREDIFVSSKPMLPYDDFKQDGPIPSLVKSMWLCKITIQPSTQLTREKFLLVLFF